MVGLGLGAKPGGLAGVADLDIEDRLHVLIVGGDRRTNTKEKNQTVGQFGKVDFCSFVDTWENKSRLTIFLRFAVYMFYRRPKPQSAKPCHRGVLACTRDLR